MAFVTGYENRHVYLNQGQNGTLTGNTFKWGVNGDGGGTRSPDYDVVLKNGEAVVVQSNVMYEGAVKESIVYDGKGSCIIKDNITHHV